jgi:hypothetical protein
VTREYDFAVNMMVTSESAADAYAQISDSGISSGALIGTVLVMSLDPLDEEEDE